MSIGRPYPNTRLYVLDAGLQPVPVGVPGELYIGGMGLTRGYLRRPALTAERFVPDPFSSMPGARLYRTGDRVRYRADGEVEFLGRFDFQVKLRGFRIELGEIEAALCLHPAVEQAVVLLREDTPGEPRLVAYARLHEEQPADATMLRGFLKERLPGYMVPAAFVVLDTLPLTSTGKVDRAALPAPEAGASPVSTFVAPRNETEHQLALLLSELLGAPQVGVHDDFFDLGGHSLLATRAVARIRTLLEVDLPVQDLFEHSTVERLALRILQLQAEQLDLGRLEELLANLDEDGTSSSSAPPPDDDNL
jgi:hypothetical protein